LSLRCLIVDDSGEFLAAARATLEREGILVVGVATTKAEALERVIELRPDVVLVDVGLGDESGFEVARRIAEEQQDEPTVILISTRAEGDFGDLISSSSAAGFLSKSRLSAGAIRAILDEERSAADNP
jgi:CheY-like chemotaxis protein